MYWEITQQIDMTRGYKQCVNYPDALMVPSDNNAHVWRVAVLHGGQPVDLTSYTCTAHFVRADDVAVVVNGYTFNGYAQVILSQPCYAVPGILRGVMRVAKDGNVLTLCETMLTVRQPLPDQVVSSGQVVPSLESIIAKLNEMNAAINAATQAATTANMVQSEMSELYTTVKGKLDSGELVGKGLTVLGTFGNMLALQNEVPNPSAGDAYAVGFTEPYDIYIWDARFNTWRNHGKLRGAKGDPGLTTSVNGVEQVNGNVQLMAGHIPTIDGRSVEQVLEEMQMMELYNGSWSTGEITLTRAARIFRLLVLVHENTAAIVPVGNTMNANMRYPWANSGSWNIIEQFYMFGLANSTGKRLNMAGSLKYLNSNYVSAADPITKIYGIR